MRWQVEVAMKDGLPDPLGNSVASDIRDLGIDGIREVRTARIYVLEGSLSDHDVRRIAAELLSDPVIECFAINSSLLKADGDATVIRVRRKPGVMDPVANSVARGVRDMGLSVSSVATATRPANWLGHARRTA